MRYVSAFVFSLSLTFSIVTSKVNSAEIFVVKNNRGENHLKISGRIFLEDGKKFIEAALSSKASAVVLASPGGSIRGAIEIGNSIKLFRIKTIVENSDYCVSACGLIWLAGERRLIAPYARVGFHGVFTLDNGQRIKSPAGNALVARYLTSLNLPERAVIFATAADPYHLSWLDSSNQKKSGINLEVLENELNVGSSGALALLN